MEYPPRLLDVTITRLGEVRLDDGPPRRISTTLAIKAPYSAQYGMVEVLARALSTGQITGYRVSVMTPKRIAKMRGRLARWQDAFTRVKGVDWNL